MLIHLIRHTTPDIDQGICYGSSDIGLATSFMQEKTQVLAKLRCDYEAIYTSPLQRCSLLAETIAKQSKNTLYYQDDRLKEYNFGDWELTPWSDFKSAEAQSWMHNFVEQAAPNGDSILSMRGRILEFWDELIDQTYEKVAIVSHSGVQRIVHGHILSTPLEKLFRLQLSYGAVMEITSDKQQNLLTIKHL